LDARCQQRRWRGDLRRDRRTQPAARKRRRNLVPQLSSGLRRRKRPEWPRRTV